MSSKPRRTLDLVVRVSLTRRGIAKIKKRNIANTNTQIVDIIATIVAYGRGGRK